MTTTLTCAVCKTRFTPSKSLLTLFSSKGWSFPSRCEACYKAGRKVDPDAKPAYPIKCIVCGAWGTVPFNPSGIKPVLCRKCWEENR